MKTDHPVLPLPARLPRAVLRSCDAVAGLASLADASVDLVVTDPPYVSLEKHRSKGTTTRLKVSDASSNEWFQTVPNDYLVPFLAALYRVMRPERHAYLFCDDETSVLLWQLAQEAGFYPWKFLTWVKTLESGAALDADRLVFPEGRSRKVRLDMTAHEASVQVRSGTGYHHANSTERILFLEKRSRPYHPPDRLDGRTDPPGKGRQLAGGSFDRSRGQAGDVLFSPRAGRGYPTEKPVGLQEVLVHQSSSPGELVLDPFFGSGSAMEASLLQGRDFVGFDTSPKAYGVASARLREVEAQVEHDRRVAQQAAVRLGEVL